jgi:hypothetical protein
VVGDGNGSEVAIVSSEPLLCMACLAAARVATDEKRACQCPGCGNVYEPGYERCGACGVWHAGRHMCRHAVAPARRRVVHVAPRTAASAVMGDGPEPDVPEQTPPRAPSPCRECERARRRQPVYPLLALLQDCVRIAAWDAVAAPPASGVVRPGWDGNTGGGARTQSTDRPDWVNANHRALDHGAHVRARLDRLGASVARDAHHLALVHAIACVVARDVWLPPPPRPALASPSPGERAVAVIEWLVPRAKPLTESAMGERPRELERELQRLLATAFATPEARARFRPVPPVEPQFPQAPVSPEPPGADANWYERRRYASAVPAYVAAHAAYERARARHPDRVRAYKAARREHPEAVRDGQLAVRVWFATSRAAR